MFPVHGDNYYHQEAKQDHYAIGDLSAEDRAYTRFDSARSPADSRIPPRFSLLCAFRPSHHYTFDLAADRHPFSFPPTNLQR